MCVLYLRLSRDDEKNTESESIANQRLFLRNYAREHGFKITAEYCDDGYSGTTFDRPAFIEMLSQIEQGNISTIMTKDLSRLGRDYIKTGYYLEQYFPLHNIRYIAVNDGIDTVNENACNDMAPFRAVFNDMYAKDISKKVRCALDTKKREGKFIGAFAPYGYKKHPDDHNKLIIDNAEAEIVKEIFALRLRGKSNLYIAKHLTEKNITTPSGKSEKWNDVTIRRILMNETYTGSLVQNKSKTINYKVHKRIYLNESHWVVVPCTHEPIISKEIFNKANSTPAP